MKIQDIKTGTNLKLEVYDEKNQKIDKVFVSLFDYAEGNEYAIIYTPLYEGNVYPIRKDTFMYVFFNESDKFYFFSAEVCDRFIKNDMHFLKIKILGDINNIQRRNDYRFKCNLPIKYRIVEFGDLDFKVIDEEFTITCVVDISGGGACILLNEELKKNSYIECVLNLEKNTFIEFIGKIIRIEREEDNKSFLYRAGLKYEVIDNKHKDTIVKFIFKEQRKLRRKGVM